MATYTNSYGEEDEEAKRRRESGVGSSQPQTFAQMQQQGYARPPMPERDFNTQPPAPPPSVPLPPGPVDPGTGGNYNPPPSQPPPFQGGDPRDFDEWSRHLREQYEGFGSDPLNMSLQEQIMRALTNPSRYDADQAQATFKRLSDDLMQGVDIDSSRRGVFHSSIPTAIGAREKGLLASRVAEDQARTFGQDRAQSISQATGYSGQRFNQQQDLLNNLLGYGQQSFTNQLRRDQYNSDEEFRNAELEWRQLYGGGR